MYILKKCFIYSKLIIQKILQFKMNAMFNLFCIIYY